MLKMRSKEKAVLHYSVRWCTVEQTTCKWNSVCLNCQAIPSKGCFSFCYCSFPFHENPKLSSESHLIVKEADTIVSFAAVFRDVKQRSPERALRDIPKDVCEGDYRYHYVVDKSLFNPQGSYHDKLKAVSFSNSERAMLSLKVSNIIAVRRFWRNLSPSVQE